MNRFKNVMIWVVPSTTRMLLWCHVCYSAVIFCPCGMLVSYSTNSFSHIKDNRNLVLMHGNIVNGHRLLSDAHTVLEPHRRNAAFFFFYSLSSFFTFFLCVCHSWQSFSCIKFVLTIYRGQQIVL